MIGTGADIHLEFATDTNVSLGAHAVFKVLVKGGVEMFAVDAKLLQKRNVLGSLATDTIILALEVARVVVQVFVFKLTDGSDKSFDAVASQMTVDTARKVSKKLGEASFKSKWTE